MSGRLFIMGIALKGRQMKASQKKDNMDHKHDNKLTVFPVEISL